MGEFRELCQEVFGVVKRNGKQQIRGFPKGCAECQATRPDDWDCYHKNRDGSVFLCAWRENYWKYDELRRFQVLVMAQAGGLDLNRLSGLGYDDFVKVAVMKRYWQG